MKNSTNQKYRLRYGHGDCKGSCFCAVAGTGDG